MTTNINGLQVNYIKQGRGKDIIFLHGWGLNCSVFPEVDKKYKSQHTVWSIDLPGFGQSDYPPYAWSYEEYAKFIANFVHKMGIKQTILVGHSLGGAIAAYYTKMNSDTVTHLVLLDTTGAQDVSVKQLGVWSIRGVKNIIRRKSYTKSIIGAGLSNLKRLLLTETNFLASGKYTKVLSSAISSNLLRIYPCITNKTLLIWGEDDHVTPLKGGKKIHQLIPNSQLVIIKGAGHHAFLQKYEEVYKLIFDFIK